MRYKRRIMHSLRHETIARCINCSKRNVYFLMIEGATIGDNSGRQIYEIYLAKKCSKERMKNIIVSITEDVTNEKLTENKNP